MGMMSCKRPRQFAPGNSRSVPINIRTSKTGFQFQLLFLIARY